jgi:hypothetical protein
VNSAVGPMGSLTLMAERCSVLLRR